MPYYVTTQAVRGPVPVLFIHKAAPYPIVYRATVNPPFVRVIPPFTSLRSPEAPKPEYAKSPKIETELEQSIRKTYTGMIPSNLATPEQCAEMPLETLIDLGRLALMEKQLALLIELSKMDV